MPTLYDEAIADAKELVRMAEENATNRLIEAVAPRIRKIVEKRLTETTNEDDDIDSIVASLDTSGEEEEEMEDMPADDAGEMDDLEGEEDEGRPTAREADRAPDSPDRNSVPESAAGRTLSARSARSGRTHRREAVDSP